MDQIMLTDYKKSSYKIYYKLSTNIYKNADLTTVFPWSIEICHKIVFFLYMRTELILTKHFNLCVFFTVKVFLSGSFIIEKENNNSKQIHVKSCKPNAFSVYCRCRRYMQTCSSILSFIRKMSAP